MRVSPILMAGLLALALCGFSFASRTPVGVDVHPVYWEERGLVDMGRADSDLMIPFSIAMRQQNLEELRDFANSVSDPRSEIYGQFMTPTEIADLVATSSDDLARVHDWLSLIEPQTNCAIGRTRDVLHCVASVSDVERLFESAIILLVPEGRENDSSVAPVVSHFGQLTIPSHMAEVVDIVQGLSVIPYRKAGEKHASLLGENDSLDAFLSSRTFSAQKSPMGSTVRAVMAEDAACPSDAPRGCATANGASTEFCCPEQSTCCANVASGSTCCTGGYTCCAGECVATCSDPATETIVVTPEVLREQYSINSGIVATGDLFAQSVVAFNDEYSSGALDFFDAVFSERPVSVTRYGPEGCLPNCDQVESDLDMQYMSSMGTGVDQWFWYNADGYTAEWAQEVLSIDNPPIVHSISYISGEYQLGAEYLARSNNEFEKMAAAGHSVIACSGDTGAPGWSINFPVDPRARNFPLSCPRCPLYENSCNQVTFTTTIHHIPRMCNLPSGMYSRDQKRGIPCKKIMADSDCQSAYTQFQAQASGACGFESVNDLYGIPRLFSRNCTCSQLPSVTVGSCTVKGFEFDSDNGSPLTSLYPASSPKATAVGATALAEYTNYACGQSIQGETVQCAVGEVACNIATGSHITSGGGFSTISEAESYQTDAVNAYLALNLPMPTGFYDSSMRAYPDVSFAGHNFLVSASVNQTEACPCGSYLVDGTSCSSPGFAGVVGLLNQMRISSGNPPLGFLNPMLYQLAETTPQAFNDVNMGDNYCTEELCSYGMGYVTANGWDPVTGLGTPNFAILADNL